MLVHPRTLLEISSPCPQTRERQADDARSQSGRVSFGLIAQPLDWAL
jgi:hypothetical protein